MLGKPHRPAAGFSFNKDRERREQRQMKTLFSNLTMPHHLLSSTKIEKVSSKTNKLLPNYKIKQKSGFPKPQIGRWKSTPNMPAESRCWLPLITSI